MRAGALILVMASPSLAQRYLVVGETEIGHFGGGLFTEAIIPSDETTPISAGEGYLIPTTELTASDGTTLGIRLTRNVSQHVSWELSWAYSFSELRRRGPDDAPGADTHLFDDLGVVMYDVSLLVFPKWLAEERVGPFVRAGIGGMSWRPADDFPAEWRPVGTGRTAGLAGRLGAGLVTYLTEDLSFRAEYGVVLTRVERDELLRLEFPFPSIGRRSLTAQRLEIGLNLMLFDTQL